MLKAIFLLITIVYGKTNTIYDLVNGKIFIHLSNNDLLSINFSIDGKDQDFQQTVLDSPPEGTDLVLLNLTLYGFNKDNDQMGMIKYDSQQHKWLKITLNFDDINDDKFYEDTNYLTSPISQELYLYGGKNGDITNRLISLDLSNYKFSNISTSTKPQPFFGASNVLINPTTQVLIGGQSQQGWLNMYQLATWDFTSGWSFNAVNKDNSTIVNSRINPTLLPIFSPLNNGSLSTILSDYKVNEILMIGGENEDGGMATPEISMLSMDSNNWYYEQTSDFNTSDYLGFATIFDNFLAISSSTNKRSEYEINMFDLQFKKIDKLNVPKTALELDQQHKKEKNSLQLKAILGSIIPICSILVIVSGVYFFMKYQKKKKLEKELSDLNYHYENYFNMKSSDHHEKLSLLYNDSTSTLDANSIDSWVRKRQEYDDHKVKENPFMQSQETLNEEIKTPEPLKTITKLNRSMIKLKKSISFNNMSPTKYSHNLLPDHEAEIENSFSIRKPDQQEFDIGSLVEEYNDLDYEEDEVFDDEIESDTEDNIDVQVLVSSKRRAPLKVVNPDLSSIDESVVRQRIPSNEREE